MLSCVNFIAFIRLGNLVLLASRGLVCDLSRCFVLCSWKTSRRFSQNLGRITGNSIKVIEFRTELVLNYYSQNVNALSLFSALPNGLLRCSFWNEQFHCRCRSNFGKGFESWFFTKSGGFGCALTPLRGLSLIWLSGCQVPLGFWCAQTVCKFVSCASACKFTKTVPSL